MTALVAVFPLNWLGRRLGKKSTLLVAILLMCAAQLAKIVCYQPGPLVTLPLPAKSDKQFHRTPTGRQRRNPADAERAWEQACRSRWRALLLVIKAKLEAVQVGISTVEDEFLAWTVLPGDARTIGERLRPQIEESVKSGKPPLLLALGGGA